jgi:hypothetical protein
MFHDTHKIADGFDVVDDQVANLQVGYLIFDSNQQFETIKVIAPEMAQVRIVDDTTPLHSHLPGKSEADAVLARSWGMAWAFVFNSPHPRATFSTL